MPTTPVRALGTGGLRAASQHGSKARDRLAQVRGSVRDRMRRTRLVELIGERHWFLSDEAAVAAPTAPRSAATGGTLESPSAGEAPEVP